MYVKLSLQSNNPHLFFGWGFPQERGTPVEIAGNWPILYWELSAVSH